MAKLRINGDSSGYVDLEAPNAASSSTLDLDQVPQKNAANTFSAVNNFTGNIGINRSTPQSKFEAWTGNGELSHFGSNNTNATNNYTGISLGYAEAGANSNYRKVGIVAVGRADGAARQDLAFLVDSNADGNSVDLNDTKMRISHEGYVTTPNQPGFHASNSTTPNGSSFTNGHDTVLKFDVVNSNVGSGWNTSTYRYTAPISGRYMIYGQARFDGITTYARVYVSVNGNSGWWTPGLHVISSQHPPSGGELWSGTVQGILPLSAGDYIELKGGGNNSVGTHQGEGSFGAYLLG